MPNESDSEKKLKLRPLELDEKAAVHPGDPSEAQEAKPDAKKLKWDTRLRQTGTKFPAKMVSKALKSSSPSSAEGGGETAPATARGQDPEGVEPGSPASKALKPEGWEASISPPPVTDKKTDRPARKTLGLDEMRRIIRRRAVKRIRLIYALIAGLVVIVFFSITFWNLGFGAGVESSLEEETKERVTVSKEFLADLDQSLADLRAGNTQKAVDKLRELEGAKTDVASLTYLLAVAAVQNGDIPLAEAKTAESISKRERISDSLALQAVLETQKRIDPSLKKFGDTRPRTEALLRQAMLADEANPFPMVELATLLRYQNRTEEALALLRGARSRLNPVDSHSVVDVTIDLATLQDTPDDQLPQITDPGKNLVSAFSGAYVAMRKGDFDSAADIAKAARKMVSADLFDYLINDPAIRRYASEPKLKEFFQ
ncbi:MAG: hypothetical protein WCH98_09490 [Verrucomicrobiota bacterium]